MNTIKKVDIIIPIYNAFDYTKQCIESILKNTKLNKNTLILINDNSTDPKMLDMLNKVVSENREKSIKLVNNKENLGFVKTVNLGMKMSNNDVVLLNSDTEVTENWLPKLQNTAYRADNIATVTPLSNNATLASIPNFMQDNEIPTYMKVEDYAKYIEEHSFGYAPELTTAHGFCMYIKRSAIDKVGYFDEETFEKGYGEENDFSYRCINNGLVNVLCDNTFIYHKGTQSFSAEKEEFINSHTKILQEKYPENYAMNTDLCASNPYSYVQDNIKYNLAKDYRKNVLIVIHEFRRKEDKLLGGTAEHVHDIINTLRDRINFHVLYFEDGVYKVKSFFETSEAEIYLGSTVSYDRANMYNEGYKALIEKLLRIIKVDLVHVHHMINHYFDLFEVINEAKIPYIISLHDYYFACPNFSLLENNEKCCVGNKNRNCEACLKNLKNLEGNFARNWRSMTSKVLKGAKRVVVPSNSAKEVFQEFFSSNKFEVVEHGAEKSRYIIKDIEKKPHDKKNIAFIGGINKIKGCDFLRKFIEKAEDPEYRYNVHLFGTAIEEDLNEAKGNYFFHGTYERENIINELKENEIDLILLLTIWPESYSYTLTEAAIAGIPVLAIDYGAVSERTGKNKLGYIVPKDASFEDIENKIDEIFANEAGYEEVLKNIDKYVQTLKTVKTMARDYEKTYEKFMMNNQNFNMLPKNEFEEVLRYSKILERKDNRIREDGNRIKEYHYMVNAYKTEIQRLDGIINERDKTVREQKARIEAYEIMEKKYNHLMASRKLQWLDKIGFIEMDIEE